MSGFRFGAAFIVDMTDDATLLRAYATSKSEEAFAELVRRHLPMVYSAALRNLNGDAHRAADIAQIVFSSVARNAARLSRHPVLTGWLYTATRHAAIDAARAELRRRRREQYAHNLEENSMQSEQAGMWERLRPVLDDALEQLKDDDRQAVLLRFFQARHFGEIAAALGLSEEAARKRVERAIEKLRQVLRRRGIDSTEAALGSVLAAETLSAAPAGLVQTITGTALANAAPTTVGASFLAMTKFQIGAAAAVAAGGGWLVISQSQQIDALNASLAAQQQVVSTLRADNEQLRRKARDAEAAAVELQAIRRPQPAAVSASVPSPAASRPTVVVDNAISGYLGEPVLAPAQLDAKYSAGELAAVFRALCETLGIAVDKLAVDSTEFPFVVHGVVQNEAGGAFFRQIDAELKALPGYTYGGSVTGNKKGGLTYFALNMTPSSAYPPEHAETIRRRLMLRLQMVAAAWADSAP